MNLQTNGPPLLHVSDVCKAIEQRTQFVYDRVQEGLFEAHRRPGSTVSKLSITRRSLSAYQLRSAQYPIEDLEEHLLQLAKTLDPATRAALARRLLQ